MSKSIVLALIASAATLTAGAAQARDVSWSIGINLPVPRIVLPVPSVYVSAPAPVYQPAPVYYEPAPVYQAAPVVYRRAPVYVQPVPVVYPRYYPAWRPRPWGWPRLASRLNLVSVSAYVDMSGVPMLGTKSAAENRQRSGTLSACFVIEGV
jgi:hypothetical protein